jgi:hypothetical protein
MDLFLEQRGLWEEVHTRLIVAIADFLTPRYQVAVEQRAYFFGQTDDFTGKLDVLIVREPALAPYVTDFPTQLLVDLYGRARLDLRIDYAAALSPAVAPQDAEWAAALLQG